MSIKDLDDEQIIEQMRGLVLQNQKHSDLFEDYGTELYRRYYRQAYLMARFYGLSREDAEEVVQDSFLRSFRGVRKFKQGSRFKPWFFKILLNVSRDRHTFLKRHHLLLMEGLFLPEKNIFEEFHIREHVRSSISRLPKKLKQAVLLRIYADLDYRSVAEVLGVTVRQVYNRLNKAYEQLKGFLEEDLG